MGLSLARLKAPFASQRTRFGEVASVSQRDGGRFARHDTLDSDAGNLPQAKAGFRPQHPNRSCAHVNLHATIMFFSGMHIGTPFIMASDFLAHGMRDLLFVLLNE